jgi:hypothetical protein
LKPTSEVYFLGQKINFGKSSLLYEILKQIARSEKNGIHKETLIQKIWGYEYSPLTHDSLIYTNMRRLREWVPIVLTQDRYHLPKELQWSYFLSKLDQDQEQDYYSLRPSKLLTHQESKGTEERSHQLVKLLRDKIKISRSEAVKALQVSERTALRELNSLLEKKYISKSGAGRGTKYYLINEEGFNMIKKNNYYYIIYRIAFGLMFFQALNPSKGFACKPFKVKSEHPKTHEVLVGNAAPISEFIFVTNDHNLPDAVKIVELSRGNQTVQGTVVYRRFNKDLAFIKVTDPLKDYCLLNSAEQKNETIRSSSLADFSGFDQLFEDEVKSFVHIVSYNSLGLEVPGIKNAIELLPHISTQFVLRESLSGSIISKNNQLLGIVSQATPQGSLLAIPAFDIQKH